MIGVHRQSLCATCIPVIYYCTRGSLLENAITEEIGVGTAFQRFSSVRRGSLMRLPESGRSEACQRQPYRARWQCSVAILPFIWSPLAHAQDFEARRNVTPSDIAPEATKILPPQEEERGDLMPLHVASVLSWLCGDNTVQTKLGTSKSGCYQELWPMVPRCTVQLQTRAPVPQNRVTGEHLDVVSFRQALRECFAQRYAEKEQQEGRTAPDIVSGAPDPLAARMGGAAPYPLE